MDRDRARDQINAQEPTFLQRAKSRGYICPVCNNGSGTSGTGITRDAKTGRFHCFKCGLHADVIELYGKANSIADYPTQLQEAAGYYGLRIDAGAYQNQTKTEPYTHTHTQAHTYTQPQDFNALYREAQEHLQETDYPQRRGLSIETCRRYGLGYLPNWKHPKAPNAPGTPRLIIPITEYSYIARDTRAEIPADQENYKKSKAKARENVSWTFNQEALRTADKPVYIVEGELDALSIIEAGGIAVAIGSTTNVDRFVRELQELKTEPAEPKGKQMEPKTDPVQPFIIALDNDNAGRDAAEKLGTALTGKGISFYRYNPAGNMKDANELLTADRAALVANVKQGEELARQDQEAREQERRDAYFETCTAAHLQEFVDGIKASVNTPYIPTGFTRLDLTLDGGLYEGLYIIGAISSLGKTTLVTQIGDQIAQNGQDVLVFSLEMARAEIMAKSISRHTLQEVLRNKGETRNAKTARGITTGRRYASYSQTEKNLIDTAIRQYAQYASNLYISEGIGDIGAAQIRETIAEHIYITGNKPVVIIDYLQILAPYNERYSDKQNTDKAVLELKRISRDYKIPVIAISSFNRENYTNAVSMQAFKESGAIEYSSDVLIGLQLAGAGEKNFNETTAKRSNPREVELVILKNRNGSTGDKINLNYYPLFNYFEEE